MLVMVVMNHIIGHVINGLASLKDAILLQLFRAITRGSCLHLVLKSPNKFYHQLADDEIFRDATVLALSITRLSDATVLALSITVCFLDCRDLLHH